MRTTEAFAVDYYGRPIKKRVPVVTPGQHHAAARLEAERRRDTIRRIVEVHSSDPIPVSNASIQAERDKVTMAALGHMLDSGYWTKQQASEHIRNSAHRDPETRKKPDTVRQAVTWAVMDSIANGPRIDPNQQARERMADGLAKAAPYSWDAQKRMAAVLTQATAGRLTREQAVRVAGTVDPRTRKWKDDAPTTLLRVGNEIGLPEIQKRVNARADAERAEYRKLSHKEQVNGAIRASIDFVRRNGG